MAPRASTSSRKKARVASSGSESAASGSDSDAGPSAKKKQKKGASAKKATAAAKGKKKKKQQDSSDEDEDEGSDSDGDAGGKKGALSERDRKDLVASMTRHVLFTSYTRKPHTRKALTEAVLTQKHTKKHFNSVIPGVQKLLRELVGMELVKMRPKEASSAKNPAATYVLRTTLPQPLIRAATQSLSPSLAHVPTADEQDLAASSSLARELAAWEADGEAVMLGRGGEDEDEEEGAGRKKGAPMRDVKREEGGPYGLMGVILGLVLVNGKVLGDDQLITHLRRLSLAPSDPLPASLLSPTSPSAVPLTLAKYIDQLCATGYLERGPSAAASAQTQAKGKGARPAATQRTQRGSGKDKVEGGDPAIEYRLGSRSEIEIGELGIAEFMRLIYYSNDQAGEDDEPQQGGRGKTGEKWLATIARAAGTAQLESADDIKVTL